MAGSIESNLSRQSGTETVALDNTPSQLATRKPATASGYSHENNIARAAPRSVADTQQNERVPLESPASGTTNTSSQTFQDQAINARISGLRAVVTAFNNLDITALDTADTASVLLLMKSMVASTQTLFGAEAVDQAFGEISGQLEQRINRARELISQREQLQTKTAERDSTQASLTQKQQTLTAKQQELTQKQQELAQKQQELADAGGSDPQLEQEIQQLEQDIQQLEQDIQSLEQEIQQLTTTLTTLNQAIDALQIAIKSNEEQLKIEVVNALQNVFNLTEDSRVRLDLSATRTGEEARTETEQADRESALTHAREARAFYDEKQGLQAQETTRIKNQDQRAEAIIVERQQQAAGLAVIREVIAAEATIIEDFIQNPTALLTALPQRVDATVAAFSDEQRAGLVLIGLALAVPPDVTDFLATERAAAITDDQPAASVASARDLLGNAQPTAPAQHPQGSDDSVQERISRANRLNELAFQVFQQVVAVKKEQEEIERSRHRHA